MGGLNELLRKDPDLRYMHSLMEGRGVANLPGSVEWENIEPNDPDYQDWLADRVEEAVDFIADCHDAEDMVAGLLAGNFSADVAVATLTKRKVSSVAVTGTVDRVYLVGQREPEDYEKTLHAAGYPMPDLAVDRKVFNKCPLPVVVYRNSEGDYVTQAWLEAPGDWLEVGETPLLKEVEEAVEEIDDSEDANEAAYMLLEEADVSAEAAAAAIAQKYPNAKVVVEAVEAEDFAVTYTLNGKETPCPMGSFPARILHVGEGAEEDSVLWLRVAR